MILSSSDWQSLWLSFKLASISVSLILIIAIPLALWLTFGRSRYKVFVSTVLTLPLILPPTVLGFYLLLLIGPHGVIGQLCTLLGIEPLAFTFRGLVIGSVIYSLPFVLLPIQNTFSVIGKNSLEVAATLGARPLDCIINILLPQARLGIMSAIVIGFAHTIGEFGIVLMIGGNIPNKTGVASIQIFNHFEAYEYGSANNLSMILLGFSFVVLLTIYLINNKFRKLSDK